MDALGEAIAELGEVIIEVIVAGGCAARTVLLFIVMAVIGLGIWCYFDIKETPPKPSSPKVEQVDRVIQK